MATPYEWDFFIAHAGPDTPRAEELYELLKNRARVFLDSRCIQLGDDWPTTLQAAQKASFVTIVMVSSQSEAAYYQQVKIAAAISMARKAKERHRVVPLFLDVDPSAESDTYGLALKHGLRLSDKLAAASRLVALIEALEPSAGAAGGKDAVVEGVLHEAVHEDDLMKVVPHVLVA